MKPDFEAILNAAGWAVECTSPFEIRHAETGSFASLLAADLVVEALMAQAPSLPEDKSVQAISLLHVLARRCSGICEAAVTAGTERAWQNAYNLVFSSTSSRIANLFEELGLTFAWDDPDSSYQDDVCAYVRALESHMEELRPFFTVYEHAG